MGRENVEIKCYFMQFLVKCDNKETFSCLMLYYVGILKDFILVYFVRVTIVVKCGACGWVEDLVKRKSKILNLKKSNFNESATA